MKKTLLITLLLIPFLGFSQTTKPIEGVLGIKFGASRAEVTAAVEAKGGKKMDVTNATPNQLVFNGLTLGHRVPEYALFSFDDDKLAGCMFILKPDNEPALLTDYNSLVSDIAEIYGTGKPVKQFKSPYKDGDGDELDAIRGGYATIFTNWESDKKTIQISILDKMELRVFYVDNVLFAEIEAKQKAKEKSDF